MPTIGPGSSPRLRGTRSTRRSRGSWSRFIPAPAGNAPAPCRRMPWPAVHPRACGERCAGKCWGRNIGGSSPRLRGTRLRLICWYFMSAVHPRACGERATTSWRGCCIAGSSPRLRGTLAAASRRSFRCRFIPAPAGNALPPVSPILRAAVHPRACGERLRLGVHRVRSSRFIPAPAGNAAAMSFSLIDGAVHPRACGERTSSISMIYHGNTRPSNSTEQTACKCHHLNY